MKNNQRIFIPGSNWVYFKIYTGIKTADKILRDDISLIITKLKKKKIISKWFFIRYNDPDFHLRVRVYVENKDNINEIISVFYKQLNSGLINKEIWKVQLDTYQREMERYGFELIDEAESLFHFDSDCIISVLKTIKLLNIDNYRWMIGLRLIDEILSNFSYDFQKKKNIMSFISNSYKKEFGFNDKNSKQFSLKYRENKKNIELILTKEVNNENFMQIISDINNRSLCFAPIINSINNKLLEHKNYNLDILLSSYIHMTLNRLFRSKNRIYELLLYDFMYMYYSSEVAKASVMIKKTNP